MKLKQKPIVFFVDYDDLFRDMGLQVLSVDFETVLFESSEKMFEILNEKIRPDIIILNFSTSCEKEINILKKLKSNSDLVEIPVVILIGMNKEIEKELFQNGANEILYKPIPAYLLIKVIKLHLSVIKLRMQINGNGKNGVKLI